MVEAESAKGAPFRRWLFRASPKTLRADNLTANKRKA
jgi:hypothetical protein